MSIRSIKKDQTNLASFYKSSEEFSYMEIEINIHMKAITKSKCSALASSYMENGFTK